MRVVVVGAGIVGASTAYHLARSGAEVVLVDRDAPGRATRAGAGIVSPWGSPLATDAYTRLTTTAAAYYPRLVRSLAEEGEPHSGYEVVGGLVVAEDPEVLAAARTRLIARRDAGASQVGAVRLLDERETREMFPYLRHGLCSVHLAGAGRVDGERLRTALVRAASSHRASYLEAAAELDLRGGRVVGVRTPETRIAADAVVVAAGTWAPSLLAPAGVNLAVAPQRGQIVHLRLDGVDTASLPVIEPSGPGRHYMLAFPGGRMVVGATRETGSGFDHRLTAAGLGEVLSRALELAPGLADATFDEARIGFRPSTADNLPLLGRLDALPGAVIATGLGAYGLTAGPYVGAQMARLTLGEPVDDALDLAALRADRAPAPA